MAVIPDPIASIREVERVLIKGGSAVVLDKFLPKNKNVSIARGMLNVFAKFFFTDITRDFETIVQATGLKTVLDIGVHFNGNFRIIKLLK